MRALNIVVLAIMLLQPVSTPGVLYAIAEGTGDTGVAQPAKETPKKEVVQEDSVKSSEDEKKTKKEGAEKISSEIKDKQESSSDDQKITSKDEGVEVKKENADVNAGIKEVVGESDAGKEDLEKGDGKTESGKEKKKDVKEKVSNEQQCKNKWTEKGNVYTRCVEEGKEYELDFDKEDKLGALKIKFTKINKEKNKENKKEISIKEVKLTDKQVEKLGALSNIAYDITSTMEKGSFEYNLTLPLPKDADIDEDKATVVYVKDEKNFKDAKDVKKDKGVKVNVDNEKHEIAVKGMGHFTIFIVKGVDSSVTQECKKPAVKNKRTKKEFCTIQGAINDKNTEGGDNITIGKGEYIEEVSVTKAVSLNCEKGAVLNGDKISTDNNPKTAFIIDSNKVVIKGCEIEGYRRGIRNGKMKGYADITIKDNYIHNLKPHSSKVFAIGDYSAIAIAFGKNTGTMMVDADAGDRGFEKIKAEKDLDKRLNYRGLKIRGNEISGKNDIYGGIVLSAITGKKSEHIKIKKNIITSMKASAIVLDSVAGVDVGGNTLEDSMLSGIFISSSEGNDGKLGGGYDMWEIGNDDEFGPKDVMIADDNTIVNNGHADKEDWGDWADWVRRGNNGISVLSNPKNIEIHNNKISLNSPLNSSKMDRGLGNGVANLLPNIKDGQVNALNNYWGDPGLKGPRDIWSGDGSVLDTNPDSEEGDYAFGNVLYLKQQLPKLIAEYKFDNCSGTTAQDSAGNHDGMVMNGAEWTEGVSQQGMSFDGIDDYVNIPGGINLGKKHTITAWVNVADFSNVSKNVVFGEDTAGYALWFQNDSTLYYRSEGTHWAQFNLTTPLDANKWYHISFVRDGENVTLFIDGALQSSSTTENDDLIVNFIGKENNGSGTQYPFYGKLDEVRFYDGALSDADVVELYESYNDSISSSCSSEENLRLNKWVCDDTFDILGDNNQMNFLTPDANGEISSAAQAYVESHCERQPESVYGEICNGVVGKTCTPWNLNDGANIINTFTLNENSPGVLTGTLETGRHLMSEVDDNGARLDNADIYGFLCSDDVAPNNLNNKWWDTNNVEFVDIESDKLSYCNVFNKGLESQECMVGAETFVNEVVSNNQGPRGDGGVVANVRSDASKVLGAPDGEASGTFYSLGKNGTITTKFEYPVANVAGNDLSFYEITWGNRQAYMLEKAKVEVSQDGNIWQEIGTVNNHDNNGVGELDFGTTGWSWIQYVRLTDTTIFTTINGDGYDLDAISAKSALCADQELEAVCGDGVKNGAEQCDDTDGVGEGEFCTKQCRLVPFYEQVQGECGDNETPVLVDEKILDSSKQDNEAKFSLDGGKKYLVQTAGTYTFNNRHYVENPHRYKWQADAAYSTGDGWTTSSKTATSSGNRSGVHSVLGDLGRGMGVVDWGSNPNVNSEDENNHIYTRSVMPSSGEDVTFSISDWYGDWYGSSCDNQKEACFNDNTGELKVSLYECRADQEVKVCKEDEDGNHLAGWKMTLGTPIVDATLINVSNPTEEPSLARTSTVDLPAGDYVIKVMGTYQYGSNKMIADAGYSYRPAGIPDGTDSWVSGFDLSSGSNGLMAWVNDTPVHWGPYNSDHEYTYSYTHAGGPVTISLYDNYYGDNKNNGNFRFEIYKKDFQGETTGEEGCVVFEDVPQGEYNLSETMQEGWENVSGTGEVTVGDGKNTFIVINKMLPVTVNATKIICTDEKDLPNMKFYKENLEITATTAQEWVKTHSSCKIAPKWEFEWQYKRSGWKKFNNGNSTQVMVDNVAKPIKVREVLPEGYLPFSNDNNNDVTAEIYCAHDGLNYDNQDWIDSRSNLKLGGEYYCVAWNVPANGSVSGMKWEDKNMNGKINRNENGLDNWTIVAGQYEEISQYDVDAKGTEVSLGNFDNNQYYALKVNGTFGAGDHITADAECSTRDGSPWSTIVKNYESYGEQLLDLEINKNKTEWGTCNPNHTYTKLIKGDGSEVKLSIRDIYPSNNTGNLNVTVYKLHNSLSTVTANGGEYEFTHLMPGEYMACEMHQENWLQTSPQSGEAGGCHIFAITDSNTVVKGKDFGNVVSGSGMIQGRKYRDVNGNGDFDRKEKRGNANRLNGWEITLFDSDWGEVSSMLTGDDNTSAGDVKKGQYRFENLPMGQYYVCEESREGWLQTEPTLESGVEHNGQYCHKVIINKPGEKVGEVQFGNFEGGIIQGRKYLDRNTDGLHQEKEKRLNGWHIRLYKDSYMLDGAKAQETILPRWMRVGDEAVTGDDASNFGDVDKGQYRFGSLMPGTYYVCEVNQTGYTQIGPLLGAHSVNFDGALVGGGVAVPNQSGQDDEGQICWQTTIEKSGQKNTWHKFGNVNYGKIIVTKWEDANANREFDNDENILSSGWGMKLKPHIDEESESSNNEQEIIIDTKENGQAVFDNLKAGTYKLSELMTENQQEEGWKMTNIYCGNDSLDPAENSEELEVEVEPGKTIECFVGNTLNPKFTISKTNNRDGQILKKGDEIVYTIVVKGAEGLVKNAIVGDLPQEFVEYVPGSAKAVSSTRGELSNPLTHVYASPGKWSLGDIKPGERVELTYRAKVVDDTQTIKQKDLAWANGRDVLGGSIQASSVPSSFSVDQGIINDHFVGTEIALAKQESSIREVAKAKKIEIEKKKEKKVVVLGAFDSNKILPQTGASSTAMLFLMALLVVLGGVILGINKSWNFKKVLIGIVTVGTIFIFTNTAQAETVVRIDQPAPKISSAFRLSFVAINTDNTAMTAKCFKKGPGDGDFVKFAEKVLILGGDSASCQVDNTVLNQAGRYSFKVGINGNTSSEVSTLFNNVASPSKPKWIKKDEKNSCENEVEFKTADDGLTTHVEIYRSHKSKEIVADASTKIKTITVGANQKYKFIDNLSASGCGDDYYYGVRAFDDYGNYSNLRSEEYEVEVTKTVKKYVTIKNGPVNNVVNNGTANNVTNPDPTQGGVVVADENTNENVNNKTENIKQPEVKGDNTKKDKVEVLGEQSKKSFISWKNWKLWLIVTGIGIGAYWLYKAKKISSINKN